MEYDASTGWEYNNHPNVESVRFQCDEIVRSLSSGNIEGDAFLANTRPTHLTMFSGVTPENRGYFAGNYRGADFEYLRDYNVHIGGFLGASPLEVEQLMANFSEEIPSLLEKYHAITSTQNQTSPAVKLLNYCKLISLLFVRFLAIHPYANGNGHIGRLIVWVLLHKKGLRQDFWSVADRPPQPLDTCINLFRKNQFEPLIYYFLQKITTPPSA